MFRKAIAIVGNKKKITKLFSYSVHFITDFSPYLIYRYYTDTKNHLENVNNHLS